MVFNMVHYSIMIKLNINQAKTHLSAYLARLPLPEAPDRHVPQLRARHGIESLALDEDAVMQIGKLPGHHRDPFDRMLVCQALAHGLTLLTPDPLISRYPVRTAW